MGTRVRNVATAVRVQGPCRRSVPIFVEGVMPKKSSNPASLAAVLAYQQRRTPPHSGLFLHKTVIENVASQCLGIISIISVLHSRLLEVSKVSFPFNMFHDVHVPHRRTHEDLPGRIDHLYGGAICTITWIWYRCCAPARDRTLFLVIFIEN